MQGKISIEFVYNLFQSYRIKSRSLSREIGIPQNAFDILMFLADNPDYNTAGDIASLRGLKANLVSVNVDRLVQDGYLERKSFPGDRRKTVLVCTPKAQPLIQRGHQLQDAFLEDIFQNVDETSRENFYRVEETMKENMSHIMKENT